MIIGVRVMEFSIPENTSLKGKRAIVRSAVERAAHRFNAAVAEVDAQDALRRAVVGFTVLSTNRAHASRMLDEIDRFLCGSGAWSPGAKRSELIAMSSRDGVAAGDELTWSDFEVEGDS